MGVLRFTEDPRKNSELYMPTLPHNFICPRQDGFGEKKEEGRRPKNQKSKGIQRKREAKTMHLQKHGAKKEDLKKKTS
jgi:hypothetical protein